MKTVLVVDDNEIMRKSVVALTKIYYPDAVILETENGAVAWRKIVHIDGMIDLLISDTEMPVMGGVELIEVVKRNFPDIFTVLMSGNLEPKGHQADIFLLKPFAPGIFLAAIKEVMEKQHA